jgi:hypothetical protein
VTDTYDALRAALAQAVQKSQPAPPDVTTSKDRRYVDLSCVQKGVRRSMPDLAAKMAVGLVRMNSWHTRRRLGVIALEDAWADPTLTAQTLLIGRDEGVCQELGAERVAAHVARRLAEAVKSRVVIDLALWLDGDEARPILEHVGMQSTDDLVWLAADQTMPWRERAACFRTLKLRGTAADGTVDWTQFNASVDRMGLTPTERLAVQLSQGKGVGEGLGETYPLGIDLMRVFPPTTETRQLDSPLVGDVLSCAIDWHCGEGKRSLAYLKAASWSIRQFFREHAASDELKLLGEAVFLVEGGRADRYLDSLLIQEITEAAVATYCRPLLPEEFMELTQLVEGDLGLLHRARMKIMASPPAQSKGNAAQHAPHLPLPTPPADKPNSST